MSEHPPEFGGSEKWRSLISAYGSLAITTSTPGFKKLSTVLISALSTEAYSVFYSGVQSIHFLTSFDVTNGLFLAFLVGNGLSNNEILAGLY